MTCVITFISRNKDNADVLGFKSRSKSFLVPKVNEKALMDKFHAFVKEGVKGEFCRFYMAINDTDEKKVKRDLAKFLIDEAITPTDWSITDLNKKVVSLASLPQNKVSKKWLFDCDTTYERTCAFVDEVIDKTGVFVEYIGKTPHGYAVIVSRGFDTREILKNYPEIELKKDAPLCFAWEVNAEDAPLHHTWEADI